MHIVSYRKNGQRCAGELKNDQVYPLMRAGETVALEHLFGVSRNDMESLERGPSVGSLTGLELALPVEKPGKIICMGLNYRDHAAEGGHAIPEYPALFMRSATSLAPSGASLIRPRVSTKFDFEAELLVVIGRKVRHASEADALDSVFGYTMFNDGSVRDYQRRSAQWTAGKNFDQSGSAGPVVVTADALPLGAHGLAVRMRVNGELLQDGNTAEMIFPVSKAIAILSEIMTLEPGDLIATGTPAGVGFARTPPRWLRAGDECEVEIESIGVLLNTVEDEQATTSTAQESTR